MSIVETLREAHKARLKRIAAAAVAQAEPAPSRIERTAQRPAAPAHDKDYERAWAAVILGWNGDARPLPRLRVEDIQRATAHHFGIAFADLLSERRTRMVARPRHVAMYLAKQLTTMSFPEIGRRFGDRDHSAVIHAVRRIERLVREDGVLADSIACIRQALEDVQLRL